MSTVSTAFTYRSGSKLHSTSSGRTTGWASLPGELRNTVYESSFKQATLRPAARGWASRRLRRLNRAAVINPKVYECLNEGPITRHLNRSFFDITINNGSAESPDHTATNAFLRVSRQTYAEATHFARIQNTFSFSSFSQLLVFISDVYDRDYCRFVTKIELTFHDVNHIARFVDNMGNARSEFFKIAFPDIRRLTIRLKEDYEDGLTACTADEGRACWERDASLLVSKIKGLGRFTQGCGESVESRLEGLISDVNTEAMLAGLKNDDWTRFPESMDDFRKLARKARFANYAIEAAQITLPEDEDIDLGHDVERENETFRMLGWSVLEVSSDEGLAAAEITLLEDIEYEYKPFMDEEVFEAWFGGDFRDHDPADDEWIKSNDEAYQQQLALNSSNEVWFASLVSDAGDR